MADYYTQFSLTTPPQDLKAIERFAQKWKDKFDEGEDEDLFPEVNIEVQWRRDPTTPAQRPDKGLIWLYAEEGANIEAAATVIADFLETFDYPKEKGIFISWAGTCSKMRTDGFSGGGIVVTREGIQTCVNSYDACREAAEGGVEVINQ